MVQINFSARNVQPSVGFEAIPSGTYPVVITKSEEKPTKSGNGSYIEFEMTVMQGHEFAGRKVFDRLNINNPNEQAVSIAYQTLSAICHVTSRLDIQATEQLHNIPFMVVVAKVPYNESFSNEVKSYKDINGNAPGAAGQVQQQQSQPGWANNSNPGQNGQQGQVQQNDGTQGQQNNGGQGQPAWAQGNVQDQQNSQQNNQVQQNTQVQQNPNPQNNGGQGQPAWAQGGPAGDGSKPAWAS